MHAYRAETLIAKYLQTWHVLVITNMVVLYYKLLIYKYRLYDLEL